MTTKNNFLFGFLSLMFISLVLAACDYVNYQQGQDLYENNCVTCHMGDGSGVAELYPALNKMQANKTYIDAMPCIIRNGLQRPNSIIEMAGLKHLSDVEINNIVNYIVNDMNSLKMEQTIQQTSSILNACQ